ncbi:dolichyl-phosphate-mannose--protein mannosyltransferase [uncultured Arthrobacter sp.]|uniref:dolichyl-phosphate-mannose--protein mannosyltransferase n=1 Tax=uncultured Arthrobacter sp. TaxID=114050 RepID=UPI0025E33715|nr:phospholipid carrier-dependent glycosyltransferase [uncultured Arthrobacter sp.]
MSHAAVLETGKSLPGSHRWVASPRAAFTEQALRARLLGAPAPGGVLAWLLPVALAVLGGVLRFVRLGDPNSLVFDETYYAKDAYSLLLSGYEREWPEDANDSFNAGDPSVILPTADYVVHPPLGKWMIAGGLLLFGPGNPFGWRFSAALVGTLSILLLAFVAWRLLGSPVLGAVAGLLLAVDGHHLVHSRTSLLDIFLMFWLLLAFAALLLDREQGRRRLARRLAAVAGGMGGPPSPAHLRFGPWLGLRPWRIAAGICLGLALGTKWSALPYLAAFGLLTVAWDLGARRVAGIRRWASGAVLKDGLQAFVSIVPLAALTYLATWSGWFASRDAYDRQWAAANPSAQWDWVPPALRSLAEYHRSAYSFHQGLASDHPYEAHAGLWLILGRPTSFFYEKPTGCGAEACSQAVTVLGNPLIWWSSALALLILLAVWIRSRDWRAAAVLTGAAAGYLPWFLYPERTMFYFYAVAFEPFLILALVYCLGLVLGGPSDSLRRRRVGVLLVGAFLAAAVLVSAYFLPIWTADVIPYEQWRQRMWFPRWI